MDAVEAWLAQYPATIAALSAVATAAAVIVSLLVALLSSRSTRTQVQAVCAISVYVHKAVQPSPRYLTATLTNVGLLPARVPMAFFVFRHPFQRTLGMISPLDHWGDRHIERRAYPVVVQPKTAELFFLASEDVFETTFGSLVASRSRLQRLFRLRPKAFVQMEDGSRHRVKVQNSVWSEWDKAVQSARAAHGKSPSPTG